MASATKASGAATPLLGNGSTISQAKQKEEGGEAVEGNQLGTLFGVFLPSCLSIFGAILFLRLPWAIGQSGVIGTLLTFALAGVTVILTTLSIAAISTNGAVKGGGVYYMISRALGPEFGGAVGLVFYLANAAGTTFYLTAFAQEVASLAHPGETDIYWPSVMYGSIALLGLALVSSVGAAFFTKINGVIFLVLFFSIFAALGSFLAGKATVPGYTGWKIETFSDNALWHYTHGGSVNAGEGAQSFFKVFVVVFPAMTGIMAGANMSGDLADPGKSIGPGTLYAIFTALVVYTILTIVIGGSVEYETLIHNLNIMQDVAFSKAVIAAGIIASTISSALGSLTGAGRIIQALARDNVFFFLKPFAWGTAKGDEPLPGIALSYLLAQCLLFIPSLNAVASLISEFFLLVYFFTNLACFVLRIAGAPNFRPKFKYFSWHTALAGAVLCLAILFLSSPVYASVSILVLAGVFVYISYTAPESEWGDVTQALIYHQVRKYLLQLDERKYHAKNWRPSVLLLVQDPSLERNQHVIDFCNNLKKGGVYILGSVLVGDIQAVHHKVRPLRKLWLQFINSFGVKAFAEITIAPTARVAYQNLVVGTGIGGMKPNTVVVPFPDSIATAGAGTSAAAAAAAVRRATSGGVTVDAWRSARQAAMSSVGTPGRTPRSGTPRTADNDEYSVAMSASTDRRSSFDGSADLVVNEPLAPGPLGAKSVRARRLRASAAAANISRLLEVDPMTLAAVVIPEEAEAEDEAEDQESAAAVDSASINGGEESPAPGEERELQEQGRPAPAPAADRPRAALRRGRSATDLVLNHISRPGAGGGAGSDCAGHVGQDGHFELPLPDTNEYIGMLRDCLALGRNALVTRNFETLDKDLIVSYSRRQQTRRQGELAEAAKMRVDIWVNVDSVDLSDPRATVYLSLQLAQVLHNTDIWSRNTVLRVVGIVRTPDDVEPAMSALHRACDDFRFDVDLRCLPMLSGRVRPVIAEIETHNQSVTNGRDIIDPMTDPAAINELMRHHVDNTCVCFLAMPQLPKDLVWEARVQTARRAAVSAQGVELSKEMVQQLQAQQERENAEFLRRLDQLTRGLPPTVLVASAATMDVVTRDL